VAAREVYVARYRLRFLLQEFDLPRGPTLIGRSADCHVTIEDPLVSRQHARIVIDGDDALFEDLGSRNGVKVNGVAMRTPTMLKDGDRLRIGTQELVFCRVGPATQFPAKTTGFLRYCAQCRLPYPQELAACPACGATEQIDEETTLSGDFGPASRHSWNVQLLVEVTEKALALGRTADALRTFQRAKTQLDERMESDAPVDAEQLSQLAIVASAVSLAAGEPSWACWAARVYEHYGRVPSVRVLESFAKVADDHGGELLGPLGDLVESLRGSLQPGAQASGAPGGQASDGQARGHGRDGRAQDGQAREDEKAAFFQLEEIVTGLQAAARDGRLRSDATNPALS